MDLCNGDGGIVVEACGAPVRSADELHAFPSHWVYGVSGD